jgi:hypothetical protein
MFPSRIFELSLLHSYNASPTPHRTVPQLNPSQAPQTHALRPRSHLPVGLTKDNHLVVWHDENIDPTKCRDTGAVTPGDTMYPYVGKYIANLTLAQLKTLDCGSLRLDGFPLQGEWCGYPATRERERDTQRDTGPEPEP